MVDAAFLHHRAVLEAMIRAGCAPHDPNIIVFDGVRRRFRVEGDQPGSRNGWLILYADGLPAGAFGSWKTGHSETWCATPNRERTEADRQAWRQRIAQVQEQRGEEERRRRAQARVRANTIWERSRAPVDARHPYLAKKQVPAIGLRQMNRWLVAPVRDLEGGLHSLEFIGPDGAKQFLKDGAVEGHGHVLGSLPGAKILLLCEGYATGASLHGASGLPVVVSFNAGNLPAVAERVRQRYPDAALVIASDDDRYTQGNPGQAYAQQAAKAVGGSVLLPDFTGLDTRSEPTDFNDVHRLGGLSHLRASVMANIETLIGAPLQTPPLPTPPARATDPTSEPRTERSIPSTAGFIEMATSHPPRARSGHSRSRGSRGSGVSRNLYQEVTNQIVEMIENGTAPWQRPWDRPRHPHAPTRPVNAATGKFYNGINILLLQASPLAFDDPRWCGYEQAKDQGWQVKAKTHGTSIYFFKPLEIDEATGPDGETLLDENGRPMTRTIPLLRRHLVFHASQIEGIPSLEEAYGPAEALPDHVWDLEAHLEALLQRSGARIVHQGVQAFYRPSEDCIYLPLPERFPNSGRYYGVAFHELGHWTGHPDRLHRPFHFDRHSPDYAREELRAELASAFLGAELGLQHDLEAHAAYLDVYLDLLRQDNREIFRAARDAQGIADLILDRHPTWQLREGVCVPRIDLGSSDGLAPDATPEGPPITTAPAETRPAIVPEDRAPDVTGTSGENPTARPAPATLYQWAAAALRELEASGEDGGELGRLARRVDAVLPWRPPPRPPTAAFPESVVSPARPPAVLARTPEENRPCRPVAPC